jgi:membrane protein
MRLENLRLHRAKESRSLASWTLFAALDLLVGVSFNLLRQYAKSWFRSLKRELNHHSGSSHSIYAQSGRDLISVPKTSEHKRAGPARRTLDPVAGLNLLKTTFIEWIRDKCPQLGAALAYYTIFSLAPLILVLLAVFGFVYGSNEQARDKIMDQLRYLIDPSGLKVIQDIANTTANSKAGILATVIGILLGLFGASGIFGQLQDALNTIWSVKAKPGQGIWSLVRARFLSFAMVGGICFLLLVSLTVESWLNGLHSYLQSILPAGHYLGLGIFYIFDLAIVILLFAMLFRFLPDARIAWRDVWTGAILTAIFFTIGKFLLGIYLSSGAAGSAYGAASSLITLLIWFFYSAQIFLFGAEFTKVYANTCGSQVEPEEHAVKIERKEIEIR